MTGPFRAGEQVLLIDSKKRRYLLTLTEGKEFHSHSGIVGHDAVIGAAEGTAFRSSHGMTYTAIRPTLADFIYKMPRGAQVIYPKDLGALLLLADIFPGARVLESGVGSGALSMTMLRAGADIVGYELREDFAARAVKNVAGFLGDEVLERYRVEQRDCYEGIDETDLDRVVLDLPEPWQVVKHAARALHPGGILVAYTPQITQVVQLRETLAESAFGMAETIEVLHRSWNIEGQSVRPDHRMVAHTGFLTHAAPPRRARLRRLRTSALNTLDVLLVISAVAAAFGGYRLGLLARVASWIGLALGVIAGARLLPPILRAIEGASGPQLLFVSLGTILGMAFVGQAIGLLVGSRLHLALPGRAVRSADRVAGGIAGVLGVAVTMWLLLPLMADVPGWFALQARTSKVAEVIDERFPEPPDTLATLRNLIGDHPFPRVFAGLEEAPDLGPPPAVTGIPQEVVDRVVPSTVKVEGIACQRIQEGSGFVAGPDLVVTNAHVVAGENETIVRRSDGSEVAAVVVAFDPRRDLAVLSAPGLGRAPLPRADVGAGAVGAVFGHPGGGPLEASPFQVGEEVVATGTDIYDQTRTQRQVLILAADLAPGDSGGALIDPAGRVVGVAFAIAPDRPGVAYALDMPELEAVLAGDLSRPVDAGPCLR